MRAAALARQRNIDCHEHLNTNAFSVGIIPQSPRTGCPWSAPSHDPEEEDGPQRRRHEGGRYGHPAQVRAEAVSLPAK